MVRWLAWASDVGSEIEARRSVGYGTGSWRRESQAAVGVQESSAGVRAQAMGMAQEVTSTCYVRERARRNNVVFALRVARAIVMYISELASWGLCSMRYEAGVRRRWRQFSA